MSHRRDIKSAMYLFEALVHTGTTLKVSIDRAMKEMPDGIPQVPSTMNIHQVVTTSPGKMVYRDVSKAFSFNTPSSPTTEDIEWGPQVIDKRCVIK